VSITVMAVVTTVPEPNLWNEICKGVLLFLRRNINVSNFDVVCRFYKRSATLS